MITFKILNGVTFGDHERRKSTRIYSRKTIFKRISPQKSRVIQHVFKYKYVRPWHISQAGIWLAVPRSSNESKPISGPVLECVGRVYTLALAKLLGFTLDQYRADVGFAGDYSWSAQGLRGGSTKQAHGIIAGITVIDTATKNTIHINLHTSLSSMDKFITKTKKRFLLEMLLI